jgi:hypothetical protein
MPIFDKLPYSLRSQGDQSFTNQAFLPIQGEKIICFNQNKKNHGHLIMTLQG